MQNQDLPASQTEPAAPAVVTADVEVADRELLLALTGTGGGRLSVIEHACGVTAGLRGEVIRLQGGYDAVCLAERVMTEVLALVRGGTEVSERDPIDRAIYELVPDQAGGEDLTTVGQGRDPRGTVDAKPDEARVDGPLAA